MHEHRIAFELGQMKWGLEAVDDELKQLSEDLWGVFELGAGQVGAVPGDVGDHQVAVDRRVVLDLHVREL